MRFYTHQNQKFLDLQFFITNIKTRVESIINDAILRNYDIGEQEKKKVNYITRVRIAPNKIPADKP